MRLGIADHFGRAVAVTASADHEVVDRRRIELVEAGVTQAPTVIDAAAVAERGIEVAARDALARLSRPELAGFWIHLDCDVVDDALMPAVDYRLPGGLTWDELRTLLRAAADTGRVVGLEVAIFNPTLDPDGSIARALVACLVGGLA
jgi:arginase